MANSMRAEGAAQTGRTTRDLARAAVSGWLGTAMEFMDFQLYSLAAAVVFNRIFFPDVSPAIGLIAAMGTYGVGYLARLVGAVFFGRMGDRIGRKKVLVLTILLMGASTTLIGALPPFETVGVLAPILLVVLRLIQGFGAGAEIAGATTMLVEYAPVRRRGVVSSLVSLGTNSGTLAASGVWAIVLALLDEQQLLGWGWRLPFLLSFAVMVYALWLRRKLKESPVFEQRQHVVNGVALSRVDTDSADPGSAGTDPTGPNPTGTAVGKNAPETGLKQRKGKAFFLSLGLRFGQAGNSGIVQTFLVGYIATTLMVDRSIPTNAVVWGSLLGFATVPVVGLLSDRWGRRSVYAACSVLTMVIAVPAMLLITSGNTVALALGMILALNVGVLSIFAVESVTMAELFGARSRFTQLALSKEIGGVLATSLGPVLAASFTAATGSWWPIAAMLAVYSLITLVSTVVSPETRGRDLVELEDAT